MAKTQIEIEEFLRIARERYEFGRTADAEDRAEAEDDNKFAYASDTDCSQWDRIAYKVRKKAKRPIHQWNRIPTYIQRIANESRKNKPAIKISPEDESAVGATANHLTARIRHIEYETNADIAKDTASKQQVTTGRGWIRVGTEWIPGTQKQRITIDPIENQFSVVDDPAAMKYDRSDSEWRFIIRHISKAEHVRKYGEDSVLARMDFTGDQCPTGWVGVGEYGEMIQIAEYWHKEYTDEVVPAGDGQPARKEKVARVHQDVIDGAQVHSSTVWLGSTLPQVPYWGEIAVVGETRRTFSLIRNAKEPQRGANAAISNLFEQVGQQSKSPWMVPQGGIAAEHEEGWANIHNTPLAFLIYQTELEGRPIPAPTRNQWEPPIQALLETLSQCFDGIKASMGIFDAGMGARSNETSGIAIERRRTEGEITNLHFSDNAARSNKYLGQILVELVGKLDRPGSSVPVRTEDGKTHVVPIGTEHKDWQTGELVTHDLLSGQYGVAVSTGPSYDSARQEKTDRDIALVQANPEMLYAIGPSMLRSDDSAGSDERADAWEQYVAIKIPGMKFKKAGEESGIPNEVKQQMQQMGQELQQTQAFAKDLHQKLEGKQLDLAQAEKIEKLKLEFQYAKLAIDDQNAKLKIASTESIEQLAHDIAILREQVQMQHESAQLQATQAHAADAQATAQEHEAGEAELGRQASSDTLTQTQEHSAEQADIDRMAAAESQQGEE